MNSSQTGREGEHCGRRLQDPGYPFSPYVPPSPDDTGVSFRTQQPPPPYSSVMRNGNVSLAEPPWGVPVERVINPQLPMWGEAIAHPGRADNPPLAPDVARRRPLPEQKPEPTGPRYHSLVLAPRSSDWRPDFPMKSNGLLRYLSRIREPRSARGVDYTLSPLLLYAGTDAYPICYDLRLDPELNDEIIFTKLGRPANSLDFCQFATTQPVDELCLWHRRFPWYIHICASQANGITMKDVLCQMHNQLAVELADRDYWTDELTARDREEMWTAFAFRTSVNLHGRRHLSRVDFLKFDCVFLGLAKSKDGMWEIKTREAVE